MAPVALPGRRAVLGGSLAMGLGALGAGVAAPAPAPVARQPGVRLPPEATRLRVAFGSCAKQSQPQPIWSTILAAQPDLFLFLGDNLYADVRDEAAFRRRYAEFEAVAPLQAFRRAVPHLAVWDDHDYGDDDAGGDYPLKALSQQLFCDAWGEPPDSPRRWRDGIYESYLVDVGTHRVQILLPDLRFNRSPLRADAERQGGYTQMVLKSRLTRTPMRGWYRPNPAPDASLLGEAQWAWLEAQLRVPADVRLLASSVQFSATGTGWEGWDLFPRERERFAELLVRTRAEGLMVLSGDMHYAELSRWQPPQGYPIWDATSSGLTEVWDVPTPNGHRVSPVLAERNFGLLDIDCAQQRLHLQLCDAEGQPRFRHSIDWAQLRFST